MKKIKILGPECPKRDQLAANTIAAAKELNLEYELTKIVDIGKITTFGVLLPPALVIDDEIKAMGQVPGTAEIRIMLSGSCNHH